MFHPQRFSIHLAVAFAMAIAPLAENGANAEAPSCAKPIIKECDKLGGATAAGVQAGMGDAAKQGMNGAAAGLSGSTAAGAKGFADAAKACEGKKSECKTKCSQKDVSSCEDAVQARADDFGGQSDAFNQQSTDAGNTATNSGSGDGMGMIAPLAMAAGAGLLGYMLGKNANKDKDEGGALQPNGSIDCSKRDAAKYSDCDQYLSSTCASSATSTTVSANCSAFNERYCAGTTTTGTQTEKKLGSGAVVQINLAGSGTGLGTPYCQNIVAGNFCKTSGRESCPSCLHLSASQSQACVANPALCLAQNSPDQIANAKVSCPTDPAFSNPNYANGGGAQVPGQVATGIPVILPGGGSPGSSAAASGVPLGGGGVSGAPVVVPGSGVAVSGGATVVRSVAGAAVREGASLGSSSSAAGASAGGSNYQVSSVGSGREVAGTGGTTSAASASRGPASDVQGKYGPSLFALSTQIISQHCKAGKYHGCP